MAPWIQIELPEPKSPAAREYLEEIGRAFQPEIGTSEEALPVRNVDPSGVLNALSSYSSDKWKDLPPKGLDYAYCPSCARPGPQKRVTTRDPETGDQYFLCRHCADRNALLSDDPLINSMENLCWCTACGNEINRTRLVFAYSRSWLLCENCIDEVQR